MKERKSTAASRIVAPAYIGCHSRVREDALVTRCSSIERDCCIDFGTIVKTVLFSRTPGWESGLTFAMRLPAETSY